MGRIECTLPIELEVHGTLDEGRLADLGAAVERAVAERLLEAERAVAERLGRRRMELAPRRQPVRERYEPQREDPGGPFYGTPSYENGGTAAGVPVQRRGGTALPPFRTFEEEWRDFRQHAEAGRDGEALAAATRLAGSLSIDEALDHAEDLAGWLIDRGQWELAELALGSLEAAWWVRYVSRDGPEVPSARHLGSALIGFSGLRQFGEPAAATPGRLVERARAAAAAGRTEQAFRLFALAFELVQMQLARYYRDRTEDLDATPVVVSSTLAGILSRQGSYEDLGYLYGLLRRILGYYPELERAALARGDREQANVYGNLGFVLHGTLMENHVLDNERGLTMESLATTTARGVPGYRIFGAADREEVVEPLPGTPPPSELGDSPAYWSTLENVVRSIAGQESFLTDLYRHPEIVTEFGATPPDMLQRADRLRLWAVMYRVFQRDDIGFGSLNRLLDLMERHLHAFTRHTTYNIRDFGVSYLSSEFPQDLLGRTVADCGVYALTVAYEVYLTARSATPRLPVSFQLYAMPEHVSLVIFDHDQSTHYIVNNDSIGGPHRGGRGSSEVLGNLARAYGGTFGRPAVVTPALDFDLGSSSDAPATFRRQAWDQYRLSTQWGFETPRGTTAPEVYGVYYEQIERFSRGMVDLRARIERLRGAIADAEPAARPGVLAAGLPDLVVRGAALMDIFERFGPEVSRVLATDNPRLTGVSPRYLFSFAERAGGSDPLTRLGLAMRFFRALGGRGSDPATGAVTLSPAEEALRTRLRAVPFIRADLDRSPPSRSF